MAKASLTVQLRVRDLMSTKLLMLQLRLLADEMRVMASPHADALERIIERYTNSGDDDVPETTE